LEQDKNKYVVVDEPCEYIVKQNIVSNPDEATELMNNCLKEKEEMLVELPPMEDNLKDQKTVLLDAEFENFLRQNASFWYEVKQVFGEFKESAKVLSNK
jgi:hypothetical protein